MRVNFLRSTLLLLPLWIAPALPTGSTAESPPDSTATDLTRRIQELQKIVKRPDAPDSLRYELALAYQAMGTIEDRRRALDLFDLVRRSYEDRPSYHWDRAMLWKECQQPSRARQCLEELLELEPGNIPAKIEIARLWLRELLYHYNLSLTQKMLEPLASALADDPDNRDALFLSSLALEMAGGLPRTASPGLTAKGIEFVQQILARDPEDVPARLLLAVHWLDIGRLEEAERHFETALARAPEDLRVAFASSRWTAPQAAVSRLASASKESQAAYDEGYWGYYDPTPLTLLNENHLEIWKRLALADFLFGGSKDGRRGWETDPGEVFVRFGAPALHVFDPGAVSAGPEPDVTLPPAGGALDMARTRANLRFEAPALAWGYRFRGLEFSLKFDDLSLNGRYFLDDVSAKTISVLRRAAPVVFHEAPPGVIRYLYLTSAGVAGPGSEVRQAVDLGVPLWRHPKERDWLDRVRVEIVVQDSTRTPVRRTHRKMSAENVYPLLPDLDVLLVSAEYDLAPGRYTVAAFVDDEGTDEHGEYTGPIRVRDYAGEAPALVLSDLEVTLGVPPDSPGPTSRKLGQTYAPNPLSLVGDDRTLDVFYELYGLSLREGEAQYEVRYTVLPRAYVLGFEHYVREGKAQAESLVPFAADGAGAGGVVLAKDNYTDAQFPAETSKVKGGRLSKGSKIVLANLKPGEYALIVTVTDMVSQATTTARTFFRIFTNDQLRELLAYSSHE